MIKKTKKLDKLIINFEVYDKREGLNLTGYKYIVFSKNGNFKGHFFEIYLEIIKKYLGKEYLNNIDTSNFAIKLLKENNIEVKFLIK